MKGYIKHITHMMRGNMMFGFGLMNMTLGIVLVVLSTIGGIMAGESALPMAMWTVLMGMGVVVAYAGMFMATLGLTTLKGKK